MALIADYLRHYLPVAILLLLVIVRLLVQALAGQGVPARAACSNIGAEVAFSFLAFWFWAGTTNGITGQLVRTLGKSSGTLQHRNRELTIIVILGIITAIVYLVCLFPDLLQRGWILSVTWIFSCIFIMGKPP